MLYFHVNIEANTERRAVTVAELIYGVDEAGSETQHRRVLNSSMRYKRMLLLKSGLQRAAGHR
jgi:predicted DNA-binding ribbon-helix-helix protein